MRPCAAAASCLMVLTLGPGRAHSDPPQPAAENENAFHLRASAAAASYQILSATDDKHTHRLSPEPLLKWTNPVQERQMHGEVYLWTDDGRPTAALCVFEMLEQGVLRECHEFTSLAASGLATTGPPRRNWSPEQSQLVIRPLDDAPTPAAAPRQRLPQMRDLAARHACQKTLRSGEGRSLRLLGQPLSRYASQKHDVTDGALFAFVEATDPEVLLLIEARPLGSALAWHTAFIRLTSVQLQATLDGVTVWEAATLPYTDYRSRTDKPYAMFFAP